MSLALRARAHTLPAWLWLTAVVLASIIVHYLLARRIVAPWIFVDELVYSDLAKSFAAHGTFVVRGVPSTGYGIVYPILIAPAWRLFSSIPDAYAAAKAIDSVVMSLAAVPAYLLARRLLPQGLSLVAALLSVLVPEMLYTGMIMTENVFYPVFLTVVLVLLRTLEAPSARRQIVLLALFLFAYETRAQAVALLAAIVTAPLLLAFFRAERVRGLRPFAVLYGLLATGAALALVWTVARGRSPLTLLGAYDAATTSTYSVSGVAHFFVYHLAGFDLEVGVLPFAALVALWFSARRGTPTRSHGGVGGAKAADEAGVGEAGVDEAVTDETGVEEFGGERVRSAYAATSLAVSFWVLAEVSAFASQSSVDRIEERNMFYLAPLAFIALLALGREGFVARRGGALAAAALVAGVLPVFIPFARFIGPSAVSDTFELLPWWWVQDHWITLQQVRWAALAVSVLTALLVLCVPRRHAIWLAGLVALYLVATTAVVDNGRHGIHADALASLWQGTELEPGWIDRKLGHGASVDVLWSGAPMENYSVWENEFFDRDVHEVLDYDATPRPDPLPEIDVTRAADGTLLEAGRPLRSPYVLASDAVRLNGNVLVSDNAGVELYRIDGPVKVLPPARISGIYGGGSWSGATGKAVDYVLPACSGGTLVTTLETDGTLFTHNQTVRAFEGGKLVGQAVIGRTAITKLNVPLRPVADVCHVRFTVAYRLVPAQVIPRIDPDPRPLGAHFTFLYERP